MSRMVRGKKLPALEAEALVIGSTAPELDIVNELRSYAEMGVPVEVWMTDVKHHRITDKALVLLVVPPEGNITNELAEFTVVERGVAYYGAVAIPNSDRLLSVPLDNDTVVHPGQTVAFGPGQITFTYVE